MIADKAVNDWLKNFTPAKWTMKRNKVETVLVRGELETMEMVSVDSLDLEMVQVTEMLVSLMDRKNIKNEIEPRMSKAFNTLVKEAYPDSGRFFLTKNAHELNVLDLTYQATRAIQMFSSKSDNKDHKVKELKNR